jgi:serine/threonine protein kinase
MNFEEYEQIESNVKDIRFGRINIYMRKTDYEDLIMEKYHKSNSSEDHEFNTLQADHRLKLHHPSLLKMVDSIHDNNTWESKSYFVYPNEDLFDHQSSVNNPAEIMRFLTQLLEVLVLFKEKNYLHGDIRPEFIYYNHIKQRYILLDRLGSGTGLKETQKNLLMYPENLLYMSPELFEDIMRKKSSKGRDLYKSEVFSLGMVLLSMFLDAFELEMCYNKATCSFDNEFFESIVEDMKLNVFSGNLFNEQISNFLFENILCVDPQKRLGPKDCVDKLKNKIAPLMLKELERVQIKMNLGIDSGFSIQNENEMIRRVETESLENLDTLGKSYESLSTDKDAPVLKASIEDLITQDRTKESITQSIEPENKIETTNSNSPKDFIEKFEISEKDNLEELAQFETYDQNESNAFYETDKITNSKEYDSKLGTDSSILFRMTDSSKLKTSEDPKKEQQQGRADSYLKSKI